MPSPEDVIRSALAGIPDPEIPVVTLAEMGIIRSIAVDGREAVVTITPTFSGCPALEVMRRDIRTRLAEIGYAQSRVEVVLSPPWSTDWISDAARCKLTEFGIAPPGRHGGNVSLVLLDPVACPYCGSEETSLRNSFGSTPCRMIFTCRSCRQPFEHIKPL